MFSLRLYLPGLLLMPISAPAFLTLMGLDLLTLTLLAAGH